MRHRQIATIGAVLFSLISSAGAQIPVHSNENGIVVGTQQTDVTRRSSDGFSQPPYARHENANENHSNPTPPYGSLNEHNGNSQFGTTKSESSQSESSQYGSSQYGSSQYGSSQYGVAQAGYEEPSSFGANQPGYDPSDNAGEVASQDGEPRPIPLEDGDYLARPISRPDETKKSSWGGLASANMKPLVTTGVSLGLVLAIFCAIVWFSKKSGGRANKALPSEIVELLGVTAITPKQQMQLVRLGNKILLLSLTQQGVQPIGEVTDNEEVARICAICQTNRPNSMSNTFRQVLNQMGSEKTDSGFLGSQLRETPVNRQPRQASVGRVFEA
jgi:flagellar biogenesis protein FliO